jgi:lipopolysaccharide/colanic/teichoic acid biosynthesis glycosyltransferase
MEEPVLATGEVHNTRQAEGWEPSTRATGTNVVVAPSPARYLALKGPFDFLLAGVGLLLAAPFIVLAAVLVKLTSRGPVFYSQVRLGLGGRPYRIFKIRTMVHNCEKLSGPRWSTSGDPRVTVIGRLLRRLHIDELPQLWNVLKGDMSLVGPRPERPEFASQLERAIPNYADRLLVRPGVTGLAQVQLPPDCDLESVRRKLLRDLYYVERVTWWLDVQILLCTVTHVLGIPFAVPQRILRVPHGAAVEQAYARMTADPDGPLQLQTA